jgi:hypothetical protein
MRWSFFQISSSFFPFHQKAVVIYYSQGSQQVNGITRDQEQKRTEQNITLTVEVVGEAF